MLGAAFVSISIFLPPCILALFCDRNTHRRRFRWWMLGPGPVGICMVTLVGVAVPKVGVMLHTVGYTLGMLNASAIIDHFGPLDVPKRPISMKKLCSILLALAGVTCACWPDEGNFNAYLLCSILSGTLVSVLQTLLIACSHSMTYELNILPPLLHVRILRVLKQNP